MTHRRRSFVVRLTFLLAVHFIAPRASATDPLFVNPDLPPLLEFLDGAPVQTMPDWHRRRDEIRRLMIESFIGSYPERAPALIEATILQQQHKPDGSTRRRIRLTFDTPHRASFEMWVWLPAGDGPFPLLLTQPRDYQIPWAELALQRGYITCLYPGVDSHHHEADYPDYENVWQRFRGEYPDATWTEISTKAWLASRSLDHLLDPARGYPVAQGQVGIIGFSRYGKQSLIAAAFDERITAVVARSPGSPGSCPYRFTSRETFAETPVDFPGQWFLESLKKYAGREHELPIDAHGWLALIAPRRCLIHTAHHDGSEPTFAVERAYLEARGVYRFLGRPENLRVLYRPGQHGPITDEQRRQNLDWFDLAFGRGSAEQAEFPEQLIHHFDWQAWKAAQPAASLAAPSPLDAGAAPDPRAVRERITWALGPAPDRLAWKGEYTFLTDEQSAMMTHDRWAVPEVRRVPVSFGENIRGNIYYKPAVDRPRPAVIWLHPLSYHSGYNEGYGVQGTTVYHRLAREGYVVLAYDQCGFGLRLLEGRDFYSQYLQWSRLGRMVHDVRGAVDFLAEGNGAMELPDGDANAVRAIIDKDRIYVLGYSVGGMVGLYAAAHDQRIAAVASFSGFTPLRTDTEDRPTGGTRRLWEWHALQPRLGVFRDRERKIPYDFHDVLSLIAPRPCLVVSPTRDRTINFNDVVACIHRARRSWAEHDAADHLTHLTPNDVNRFQADQHRVFLDWAVKLHAAKDASERP